MTPSLMLPSSIKRVCTQHCRPANWSPIVDALLDGSVLLSGFLGQTIVRTIQRIATTLSGISTQVWKCRWRTFW
jgi:hypothetical protein